MEEEQLASVLIVDQQLDHKGIIANAAFVLGLTAGREMGRETFGMDVVDKDGSLHRYLTKIGHFVRKAGQSKIRTIRESLANDVTVSIVDYPEDAAPSDYSVYTASLNAKPKDEINYRALHIIGPERVITPLTKNLSRL